MGRKIHIPKDLQLHEVKLPGKGINLSVPTAQDGLAAMEYFIDVRERLLTDGMPYNEAARAAFSTIANSCSLTFTFPVQE